MSFCGKIKKELCAIKIPKECCALAECYGLLLFARIFSKSRIVLQTESEDTAHLFATLIKKCFSVSPEVIPPKKGLLYTVRILSKNECSAIVDRFGADLDKPINEKILVKDCCAQAFLRGAFLSCGAFTDPNREYHMEFPVGSKYAAQQLFSLSLSLGFHPKFTIRGEYYVVYFKESGSIEDLLTYMGATTGSLELMEIKVYKNMRNKINRLTNFETANLSKTVNAAAQQCEAIELLKKSKKFSQLPDELRTAAELRIQNPDLSLNELCTMSIDGISRSGLNHRLQKLVRMAEEL